MSQLSEKTSRFSPQQFLSWSVQAWQASWRRWWECRWRNCWDGLPESIQNQIDHVTEEALAKALTVAMKTLDDETVKAPWNLTHKVAATLSGVTGGLFGAPALFAELPVTTVIILRSIADIARSKGENLSDPRSTFRACDFSTLIAVRTMFDRTRITVGERLHRNLRDLGPWQLVPPGSTLPAD